MKTAILILAAMAILAGSAFAAGMIGGGFFNRHVGGGAVGGGDTWQGSAMTWQGADVTWQ